MCLMVVWGVSFVPLSSHIRDGTPLIQLGAFLCGAFISGTMMANFLYTSGLEEAVKKQKDEIERLQSTLEAKTGSKTGFKSF